MNYGLISITRLAKPEEYEDLKEELEGLGYTLEVVKRLTQKHLEVRKAELNRLDELVKE